MITAGSGTTIAADEVADGTLGTVKVQYVKLMDGTLDGTNKAGVGSNGLKVDGSAVTQPVSGTLTANIGTSGSLALDATLTGGTQKAIARGGAKGSTSAADVTSSASGANHQLLDVAIYDASGNQITSFGGGGSGTQYTDGASAATPTGMQSNWNESGTQRSVSLAKPLPIQPGTSVTFAATQSGTWNINSITTLPALPAGSNAIGKLAANSGVDIGDVDVTSILPGTGATNLGKAEDAAHASGDVGVMALAVRNDAISTLTSASGDYAALTTNAFNQLHVTPCAITTISQTPTVSTTPAYTAGDAVGGKLTFANATRVSAYSGRVKSVIVTDQNKQNSVIDLVLFNADPSGTTFTDNAILDIADADMVKIIARVPLVDWVNLNDNAFCAVNNLSLDFNLASGSALYGCLVTRGTPTFAATSDIIVTLVIEQD